MIQETEFDITFLKAEDSENLYQLFKENKSIFQEYFPVTLSQNKTKAATAEYIAEKQKEEYDKTEFTFAIHTKVHPEIAGLVILKEIDLENKEAEFAFCLSKRFQGRGWVAQAVSQMIDFAFVNHHISTFKIITHKSNLKSIVVAEQNGFKWIKTLEKEFKPAQEKARDMELYLLKK